MYERVCMSVCASTRVLAATAATCILLREADMKEFFMHTHMPMCMHTNIRLLTATVASCKILRDADMKSCSYSQVPSELLRSPKLSTDVTWVSRTALRARATCFADRRHMPLMATREYARMQDSTRCVCGRSCVGMCVYASMCGGSY
jgi:hypothetical protein